MVWRDNAKLCRIKLVNLLLRQILCSHVQLLALMSAKQCFPLRAPSASNRRQPVTA
jgi:hypothetical protein